ncbi:hypothetical protein [uncultured Paraglaciecola sp.]|uniref:hypothetical protein n=1 Tax=uncultured Paraglaciecola sp. TaxID=1765024 RepID=UPI0026162C32|nr:hypothetical protein [uncultured Paraglaciecola sp.]
MIESTTEAITATEHIPEPAQEQVEQEPSTAIQEALDNLRTDDAEPETPASVDEPAEQSEVEQAELESTDDGEPERDSLLVNDDNLDTQFMRGDDVVTIGELFEHYDNRTAPENINAQRQELESRISEFEAKAAKHDYIDDDVPAHVKYQKMTEMLYEDGQLDQASAEHMIQAFKALVDGGHYSVTEAENRASQRKYEREQTAQREQIEAERRQLENEREVLSLENKYSIKTAKDGELTPVGTKIMSLLESANKKNQPLTLTEAFDLAAKKGYFKKPPKTRASLADEFRTKGTKSDAPAAQATTTADALSRMMA